MKTAIKKAGQRGFTLIELIITIVIIGVLAAVAIPKFLDLSNDAEKGVAAGIAGALASATSVNYSKSKVPGATAPTDFKSITSCADIQTNLAALADVPSGYSVTGTATLPTTGVATAGCSVTKGSVSIPFNAYGA